MPMSNVESLFFPKSIYKLTAIRRAITDYEPICQVEENVLSSGVTCRFTTDGQVDAKLVAFEFSNYLIELLNASDAL